MEMLAFNVYKIRITINRKLDSLGELRNLIAAMADVSSAGIDYIPAGWLKNRLFRTEIMVA